MAITIELFQGDITTLKVDAIVNAANSSLMGGGGVDGAIHHKAGPELLTSCKEIRATSFPQGLPTGEAVITPGFNLPASFVIHTVGPRYGLENGQEAELLTNCYKNSLDLAKSNNLKTIAFPCISTGIYGYPKESAANIAVNTIKNYLAAFPDAFDKIIFAIFSDYDFKIYQKLLNML